MAPDGSLSREVRDAIEEILKCSPLVYEWKGRPRFKILRDSITCLLTDIKYTPLNYTNSRFDGKLPNVFLADEVGALPNGYAVEAMRSGQLNILNKLGCIISTKYPTVDNPFENEVSYAKKVLDGVVEDDTVFALLYEPDKVKGWETDDLILKQGNPASLEIEEIWEDLLKKRARAIEVDTARENFLTKHCNIIYQGIGTETYVDVSDLRKCKVDHIDWEGREVFVAADLSMSNDNTSVGMVAMDNGVIYAESICFIPEGRIEEKSKKEKLDYRAFIETLKCIACGDMAIDYSVVEDFVFEIENKYGVHIKQIGFDRWNAMSSAQKWEERYETVEIKQHSSVLHPATKLLYEKIVNQEFAYEDNLLLEINFQNARCSFDTNMNRYVNKKKSNGKVDMVVSLINAVHLAQMDSMDNTGFLAMVI